MSEAPIVKGQSPEPSSKKVRRLPVIDFLGTITPNKIVSTTTIRFVALVQIVAALLLWLNSPFKVLPTPMEVFSALQTLWMEKGLGPELITSCKLNFQALFLTAIIGLVFSYITVLPFFRPLVSALTKGRFLSLVGFSLIFTLLVGGGYPLKLSLLVFGMTVFFLTSMASTVEEIPKEKFDHARTLRMGEWRVVWEVIVRGTAEKAFEVMRQNAAIGWMMLTMVEGIVRSEGGIGTVLLSQQKFFRLPEIYAIQLVILLVGIFQDYLIGFVRKIICPYADLALDRKVAS